MSSTSNEEYVDRGAGDLDRLERLWAPYRMNYIVDKSDTNGSGNTHTNPFVVIPTLSDEDGLIVARGTYVYCVLNLFPYNSGHMMVVPYREEPNLENLTPAESAELMAFAQAAIRVLKTASRRLQRRLQPGPLRRRLRRPTSPPAHRAPVERRQQLHDRHQRHKSAATTPAGHPHPPRPNLGRARRRR